MGAGERGKNALGIRYNTIPDLAIDAHSRILHIAKTVGGMPRLEETESNGGNTSISDVASSGSRGRNPGRFDRGRGGRGAGHRAAPRRRFVGVPTHAVSVVRERRRSPRASLICRCI
jgi:hypothetical protein